MTLQYNNPLVDKDFLIELDAKREREVYAKIIALDFNESPVQQIEGRVTQGSVNIDGSSAVRRTCSLNLVGGKDLNINDFYWGLNNKFKLEIGLRNTINTDLYPEIIWFPQGVYLITAFNTSTTTNNYAISINGKDKMCLLNGEIGGSLTASIDFGVEEFYNAKENTTTFTPIPIEKIIREAVHFYAGEPYHNIVINDLEDVAVELLEYRGDEPLYLLRNSTGEFDNFTDNGDAEVRFAEDDTGSAFKISELEQKGGYYDPRVELAPEAQAMEPSKLKFKGSNNIYTVARIEYGQTVGYRQTELTYAGNLISNIGESITSILDKIKNMLGEFEYFYDLDGRFIFQKKKTYIQTSWNNIVKIGDEQYVDSAAHSSATTQRFEGNTLVTSFQNSPNLNNLRNDFAVWGEKKGVSGEAVSIHYRYAIDTKPERYVSIAMSESDLAGYNSEHPEAPLKPQESKEYLASEYDWRELIYQMANDYYKYNQIDSFYSKVIAANKPNYHTGTTGYEQYYSDIYSFWRQLYNSNPEPHYSDFNKRGDEETFTCVDAHENNIPLFIKGKYVKVTNPNDEDSTVKIFALKEVSYSEDSALSTHKELIPWLEAIEIPYTSSFGSNPIAETESSIFYVVGPNDPNTGEATYKKVQYSIRNQLDKQELFVHENGKYVQILNSSYATNKANSHIIDFYKFQDDKIYYDVTTEELSELYCNDGVYNRYLYQTPTDIEGKFAKNDSLTVRYAIEYFGEGYNYIVDEDSEFKYWTTDLINAPSQLIFWFDFLDGAPWWTVENQETGKISIYYDYEKLQEDKSSGKLGASPRITQKATDLSQFSVKRVGDRTKAVNDKSVTAIYFREVPNLIFTTYKDYTNNEFIKNWTGYTPVFIKGNLESMFSISSQGKSAQDAIDELLYNYSYCVESVTIQTVPIYHLQPNTRIFVRDDENGINGEYLVSKLSMPLTYNGTMSITATKAPERLY